MGNNQNHPLISQNASQATVEGIICAFEIVFNVLGVDKHTGQRILDEIETAAGLIPDPEYREGMMKVHAYIKNKMKTS